MHTRIGPPLGRNPPRRRRAGVSSALRPVLPAGAVHRGARRRRCAGACAVAAAVGARPTPCTHPLPRGVAAAATTVGHRPRRHCWNTAARGNAKGVGGAAVLPRRLPYGGPLLATPRRCGGVEPYAAVGFAAAHRSSSQRQTGGERGKEPPRPPRVSAAHRPCLPISRLPPPLPPPRYGSHPRRRRRRQPTARHRADGGRAALTPPAAAAGVPHRT